MPGRLAPSLCRDPAQQGLAFSRSLPETRYNSPLWLRFARSSSGLYRATGRTPLMQLNRLVPVAFALTLCGCGSIGSIGVPPAGTTAAPPPPICRRPASGGNLSRRASRRRRDRRAAAAGGRRSRRRRRPCRPRRVAAGPIGRTDLLGGWTIASSGDSCQLFMTLTSWTGGYRASTRGCASEQLKSISAWNLNGSQVVLAGQGGVAGGDAPERRRHPLRRPDRRRRSGLLLPLERPARSPRMRRPW